MTHITPYEENIYTGNGNNNSILKLFSPTPGGKVFFIFLKLSIQFYHFTLSTVMFFQTTFYKGVYCVYTRHP